MKIAFIVFDEMTTLDFVGVYDAVRRLKTMGFIEDFAWDICARASLISDHSGLLIVPNKAGASLADYDMVIVPGGYGTRDLVNDREFMNWMRTAAPCKWKVSVCTGSVLLGAAGFLEGRRATTHPSAFDELRPYCAEVIDERIVDEGDVITARGVTSAIDLGLYLCEKLAGTDAKERIRRQMDYEH